MPQTGRAVPRSSSQEVRGQQHLRSRLVWKVSLIAAGLLWHSKQGEGKSQLVVNAAGSGISPWVAVAGICVAAQCELKRQQRLQGLLLDDGSDGAEVNDCQLLPATRDDEATCVGQHGSQEQATTDAGLS